jgi:hypothetical protein
MQSPQRQRPLAGTRTPVVRRKPPPELTTDAVFELVAPSVPVLLLLAVTEPVALRVGLTVCKQPMQRRESAGEKL